MSQRVGEVGNMRDVLETESSLQCIGKSRVVLTDQDVIDDMCKCLLSGYTFLRSVRGDWLIIFPEVVDSFGDARGRYGALAKHSATARA